MKASPSDQRLLLDIVDIDVRIARADEARTNPPQATRVKQLIAERNELGRELIARTNARDEAKIALDRVAHDIDVSAKRAERDRDRLTRTAVVKDINALEAELASLARRIDTLETQQLEVMETLEAAESAVAEQQARLDEITSEGQRLSAEAKQAISTATNEAEALRRDREAVTARVPEHLLAAYLKLAARQTGAGLLQYGTCGGCHMALAPTAISTLADTAADEVANCPECGCILVRTEESGL